LNKELNFQKDFALQFKKEYAQLKEKYSI